MDRSSFISGVSFPGSLCVKHDFSPNHLVHDISTLEDLAHYLMHYSDQNVYMSLRLTSNDYRHVEVIIRRLATVSDPVIEFQR